MKRAEILEMRDKLIKDIETDMLNDFKKSNENYGEDYDKNVFCRYFFLNNKNLALTFDDMKNILFWYYQTDDDNEDKESTLFELIVNIRDSNTAEDFYDMFSCSSTVDGFIYDSLEHIMWEKDFKDNEKTFTKLLL